MAFISNTTDLLPFIDFTYLKDEDNQSDYMAFLKQAASIEVACLCLYSKNLKSVHDALPKKRLAVVINFPKGNHPLTQIEGELAQSKIANEIDVVFPYFLFLSHKKEEAYQRMREILSLIPKDKLIKVIIESGIYSNQTEIKEICDFLITQPIHFIKTSTGKIKHGASIKAVTNILSSLKNTNIGLKVSGGIRTLSEATEYIELVEKTLTHPITAKNFRIGCSKLL